jgi:hypothetical protein
MDIFDGRLARGRAQMIEIFPVAFVCDRVRLPDKEYNSNFL